MNEPLFIATERFDPTDGEKWQKYFEWAKIPKLKEVVGLDTCLSGRLIRDISDEDWKHIAGNDGPPIFFSNLNYLLQRVQGTVRRNILGAYRNPAAHINALPGRRGFVFVGYDLIEDATQISALTNCGGFSEVFTNEELNCCGLISEFERAVEIQRLLLEKNPEEPHADCQLYAIWRLIE